jgi:hypothetical protein
MKGNHVRTRVSIAAILLALCSWASAATAGDDAEAHYKKGRSLYNVSEYRAALDEFKRAYVEHADPALLYNSEPEDGQLTIVFDHSRFISWKR